MFWLTEKEAGEGREKGIGRKSVLHCDFFLFKNGGGTQANGIGNVRPDGHSPRQVQ